MSTPLDVWHGVFQVNVFAPVMLARALIEPLQQGNGTVVNVTSIAGSRVHEFAGTAYAASKAALSALTREMASDFGKRGVRVNAIAPGEILTGILSPGSEEAMLPSIPWDVLVHPRKWRRPSFSCVMKALATSTEPSFT